jgi:lysozyme family protein
LLIQTAIDSLITREGDYVDHPNDRGGPTRWGITEQVARAYGYTGPMRTLPRDLARDIYLERYWTGPGFHLIAQRSAAIAEELLDTGVNMGPKVAARFLQRALNVLNRNAQAWPDIDADGDVGRMTLFALDQYLAQRGAAGVEVLLRALNAQQAVRYIEIAEAKPSQESFMYGWIRERVGALA